MSLGGSQTSPELLETPWTSQGFFPTFSEVPGRLPRKLLSVWFLGATRGSPEVSQIFPEAPRTSHRSAPFSGKPGTL